VAQSPEAHPNELKAAYEAIRSAETFVQESFSKAPASVQDMAAWKGKESQVQKGLQMADAGITKYLEKNPRDVAALFLQVRLDRVKSAVFPGSMQNGQFSQPGLPSPDRDPQKTLDLILQIDPYNPAACYWKARFFGSSEARVSQGRLIRREADFAKAAELARVAVKEAPENVEYREALATYLLLEDKRPEAEEVLKPVQDGRHPMYRLLLDQDIVSVPANAVFDPQQTNRVAEGMMQSPAQFPSRDFLAFRVRSYLFPGPASKIEEYYRARWPGLQLKPESDDEFDSPKSKHLHAVLVWRGNALEVPPGTVADEEAGKDGFLIFVNEDHERPAVGKWPGAAERRAYEDQLLKAHPSDIVCSLNFVNMRKF
jgi:hypothetical protein